MIWAILIFFCMRQRIALFMKECCDKYPWTKLVWSDILPRACYFGTINPSKLEMKRQAVNRWARSLSRRMGVSVLHHPQFRWSEFSLYRYDGVHLSHTGNMHFQSNLRDSICAPPWVISRYYDGSLYCCYISIPGVKGDALPVVPVGRALCVWQKFAGNDGQCLDSCLYDNQIILVNRFSIKLWILMLTVNTCCLILGTVRQAPSCSGGASSNRIFKRWKKRRALQSYC